MDKKIVVIDDDEGILEAFQAMLESVGYSVDIFPNADAFVPVPKTRIPSLIILDILLSGVDGRDICVYLKNQLKTKDVPIIMVSAHPNAHESVQSCGADDYLEKPFEMDMLLEKVEKYIGPPN